MTPAEKQALGLAWHDPYVTSILDGEVTVPCGDLRTAKHVRRSLQAETDLVLVSFMYGGNWYVSERSSLPPKDGTYP